MKNVIIILCAIIVFLWVTSSIGPLFELATEISRAVRLTTHLILPNFSTSPKPHWEGGQIIRPDADQINKANENYRKRQGTSTSSSSEKKIIQVGTTSDNKEIEIYLGMHKNEVLINFRYRPQRINKSTTKWGVREQWVYEWVYEKERDRIRRKTVYLYFDNEILTGWQD